MPSVFGVVHRVALSTRLPQVPGGSLCLFSRAAFSVVFDGRYKFARYYAPDDFNTPTTLEALLANNEIELFDLQTDPDEMNNLGVDPETHKDLIMRMNDLLNRMIAKEVGINDGSWLQKVLSTY